MQRASKMDEMQKGNTDFLLPNLLPDFVTK